MNIVMADGGLGNQLFHLAFALYLSETSTEAVAINTEMDAVRHRHGTVGLTEIADALRLPRHKGRRPGRLIRLALLRRSLETRRLFSPLASLHSCVGWGGVHVYAGYWQDFESLGGYYQRVADACIEVLSLQPGDQTCLHIRFGDYKSPKNRRIYAKIGAAYYAASLQYLKVHTGRNAVRVLTNDTNSARDLFAAPEFANVVFRYEPSGAVTDFSALGQSAELIASNSTFSWWAALISARLGNLSHLVAPAQWFNPGYQHRQSPSYATVQDLSACAFDQVYF